MTLRNATPSPRQRDARDGFLPSCYSLLARSRHTFLNVRDVFSSSGSSVVHQSLIFTTMPCSSSWISTDRRPHTCSRCRRWCPLSCVHCCLYWPTVGTLSSSNYSFPFVGALGCDGDNPLGCDGDGSFSTWKGFLASALRFFFVCPRVVCECSDGLARFVRVFLQVFTS